MAEQEYTTMNLMNDVRITNAKLSQTFSKGQQVRVPKDMADDVARMDYEASQAKADLVRQPKEYQVPVGINPLTGQRWE